MTSRPMILHCQNCKARLTEALVHDQGEHFIPCFGCGVRNLVSLQPPRILGYRPEYPFPARQALPSPSIRYAGESIKVSVRP